MRRLGAAVAIGVVGVTLATAGCGRATKSTGAGEPANARYGSPELTVTTAPLPPTTAEAPEVGGGQPADQPPAAGPADPPRVAAGAANRTDRDDPSGFHLTLVVDGDLSYRSDEDFLLELTYSNTTDRVLYQDSNQNQTFVIQSEDGQRTWTNQSCHDRLAYGGPPRTGPVAIGPGESGRFVANYPAVAGAGGSPQGPDPDRCRLPPGTYLVTGVLDWCPDDAMARSDYNHQPYCDPERIRRLQAKPLRIAISA